MMVKFKIEHHTDSEYEYNFIMQAIKRVTNRKDPYKCLICGVGLTLYQRANTGVCRECDSE